MLKNSQIIDSLTVEQKIEILLKGSYESAEETLVILKKAGLEEITFCDQAIYPSFTAMINSWDKKLVEDCSSEIVKEGKRQGVTVVKTPKANVRSNVYAEGYSEDPVLSGKMIGTVANAIIKQGVAPIVTTCALTFSDVRTADKEPNLKALMEYYLKPFKIALDDCPDASVSTSQATLKGNYKDVNLDWSKNLIGKEILKNGETFCEKATSLHAVESINEGILPCYDAHHHVIKEALNHYKVLRESVDTGMASVEELEQSLRDGSSLSPETLDEMVDRIIEFAKTWKEKSDGVVLGGELTDEKKLRYAEQTIVLLKNKEVLPIRGRKKIAVIGDVANTGFYGSIPEYFENKKDALHIDYVGFERGYDVQSSRNDDMIKTAVSLASKSDEILLFVGFSKEQEEKINKTLSVKLPGNQSALVDALVALRKKIIVVITGTGRIDAEFDKRVNGVLYAPYAGKYGIQALMNVIFGKASPSGRLPFTIYSKSDEEYSLNNFNKENDLNKVGTFIGYRRYVSENRKVKYPFGFGLSYSSFEYKRIKSAKDEIAFKVKNVGKRKAIETIQFYYDKSNSAFPRPKRELFDFESVELSPGQTKIIRKKINPKDFAYYDESLGKWQTEQGHYNVYVSRSVSEEVLTFRCLVTGEKIEKSNEGYVDYLQSMCNIVSGEYYMETKMTKQKYKSGAKWFLLVSFLLAALINVFAFFFRDLVPFFNEGIGVIVGICVAGVLDLLFLIGVVWFFVSLRNKSLFNRRTKQLALNDYSNEEEQVYDPTPYEKLFMEEFPTEENSDEEEIEEEEEVFVVEETIDEYYDKDLTLSDLKDRFTLFALERGITIDSDTVKTLFSSMSVSRFIVLKINKDLDGEKFLSVLSEFFSCPYAVDDVSRYTTPDELLVGTTENSENETQFVKTLKLASDDINAIKIACFKNMYLEETGNYFTSILRYLIKPNNQYNVYFKNKSISDNVYKISPNVFMFALIDDDSYIEDLSSYVAETACFMHLNYVLTEEKEEKTEVSAPVSITQFEDWANAFRGEYELGENHWKKLDKLENYVKARGEYRLSNKMWQKMEKFTSVYLGLGGEEDLALDTLLAVKILSTLIPVIIKNKRENDEFLFDVLENVFGDDKVNVSRSVIECSLVDVAGDVQEEIRQKRQRHKEKLVALALQEEALEEVAEITEEENEVATYDIEQEQSVEEVTVISGEIENEDASIEETIKEEIVEQSEEILDLIESEELEPSNVTGEEQTTAESVEETKPIEEQIEEVKEPEEKAKKAMANEKEGDNN